MLDDSCEGVDSRRPSRRRLLFATVTVFLCTAAGVGGMLSVFRDVLQSYLHISMRQFGLLLSIGAIPSVVGSLCGGMFVDRWGPRLVLRVCFFGCAAGMVMAGLSGGFTSLLVAVGVMAFFSGPLYIGATSYLVRLFPNRRRRALSLSMVAGAFGGIVFSLLAEVLLKLHEGPTRMDFGDILHIPFLVVAGILVLGALMYRQPRSLAAPAGADSEKPARIPLTGKTALLMGLLTIHGSCDGSVGAWLPRVLKSASFSDCVFAPGAVVAAASLAYVVSRMLLSLLPEHRGKRSMMIAPGLVGGSLFLAGLLSRSQVWTPVGFVAGALCWSVEYPVLISALAGHGPRRFGSALALTTVGMGLGSFVMTNVMGYVGERVGESSLWVILLIPAAGYPLVGLGGAVWVWRFAKRTRSLGRRE